MDRRRKIYLVNKNHQLKYIAAYMGSALLALFCYTLFVVHDINSQIESYIQRPTIKLSSTGEIILPIVLKESVYVSAIILLVIFVMSMLYFRHTHRLVGKLDETVKKLKEGDFAFAFKLDDGADFQKTEEAFNVMLAVNRDNLARLQDLTLDIEKELGTLPSASSEECKTSIKELNETVSGLDRLLSGYKLA